MYHCEKCKLAVVVTKIGEIFKACKCNASIIAEMKATVYNHSKLKS